MESHVAGMGWARGRVLTVESKDVTRKKAGKARSNLVNQRTSIFFPVEVRGQQSTEQWNLTYKSSFFFYPINVWK